MNCNCNRTTDRMEDTTVDMEPRVQIEISAELARNIGELAERLKQLHPEDAPSVHYALGFAVSSGLIAVSDELRWRAEQDAKIAVLPPYSPTWGGYRTLANPRARLEGAGA